MRKLFVLLCISFTFVAACSGNASPLAHSLYYLSGRDASAQVWRMDPDGVITTQITHEENGVQVFSVSPADGSLAVVTNNQLFLADPNGADRRLIADASAVDENIEEYYFRATISDPVFSPDGATLAYGFDGIHLYDVASGEDRHVLTNLGNLLGEIFVFAKEDYAPGPWSPDGSRLLITMGYVEGSTLAVIDPDAEQPFTRLRSDGPVCCNFSWSADSRSVMVANPYYTGDLPGLWRYDAETGAQVALVPGIAADGSMNYVGWPFQGLDGTLFYFFVNLDHFSPDTGIPLTLVRSAADGSGRTQLHADSFYIHEALWAADGSLALLVEPSEAGSRLLLAPTNGGALQVLLVGEGIRNLAWGP